MPRSLFIEKGIVVRTSLLSLFLFLPCASIAVESITVTPEDIAAARERNPVISQQQLDQARASGQVVIGEQELDKARKKEAARRLAQPSIEELMKHVGAGPNIKLPEHLKNSKQTDVAAVAKHFLKSPGGDPKKSQPSLYVFVSFSMPVASLDKIIDQASLSHAVIVVRGLYQGSFIKTTQRVRELIGDRKVAWVIDPTLFKRYSVDQVPVLVLQNEMPPSFSGSCEKEGCASLDSFVKVTGDVTIDYGLDMILQKQPLFSELAKTYLRGIRGG